MSADTVPTVYELSVPGRHGIDLPTRDVPQAALPADELRVDNGLPELSQLDVVRHYLALSQRNFGIDSGFYPLGSCTMKFNPKINEHIARLSGFAETAPAAGRRIRLAGRIWQLMFELQQWLAEIGGFDAVVCARRPALTASSPAPDDPRVSPRARRHAPDAHSRPRLRAWHQSGHHHHGRV